MGCRLCDAGGGFGIAYTSADDPAPIEDLAQRIAGAVRDECARNGIPIPAMSFEPGRVIVGPAGVTLYRVGTVKPVQVQMENGSASRTYVSVDGGMSDNPRPSLYGAEYSARIASRTSAAAPALVRIAGKHCESGDLLVRDASVPDDLAVGDVLCTPVTGAYGHSMGSNYNKVTRPPVVFCRDGDVRLVVRRETDEDLLSTDVG